MWRMFPCALWSYTVWEQFICWNWLLERQPYFEFIFWWFTPRTWLDGRFPFQLCMPCEYSEMIQSSSVQSLNRVRFAWTAAHQAISNSLSLLKLMSLELVMTSDHLILCHPLLLPPSVFPRSGCFPMSQFFASDGQGIGVSAPASVLPEY